jgi:hypothetical protein
VLRECSEVHLIGRVYLDEDERKYLNRPDWHVAMAIFFREPKVGGGSGALVTEFRDHTEVLVRAQNHCFSPYSLFISEDELVTHTPGLSGMQVEERGQHSEVFGGNKSSP